MLGKYIYDINQKRRVENDLPLELLKNGLTQNKCFGGKMYLILGLKTN